MVGRILTHLAGIFSVSYQQFDITEHPSRMAWEAGAGG
jgi:hypothetical protein